MSRALASLRAGFLAGSVVIAGSVAMSSFAFAQAQPAAPAAPAQPRKPAAPAAQAPAAQKPAQQAQDDSGPSRTSATYEDWVVRCERGEAAGSAKVCEVAQTLQIGNPQQGLVAQVVLGKLAKDAPLRLVLQLPVGVWLPGGATFTAGDNGKPIAAPYKFCIRACIADADLSAQDAAALSNASGAASLVFQDRNEAQITLPVSLKGLAQALAARDKM